MDTDKEPRGVEKEVKQTGHHPHTEQISRPSRSAESLDRLSIDKQDSTTGTDADADLLSSDMDSAGDGYRRRRAQLMDGLGNGSAKGKGSSKKYIQRPRNAPGVSDEENKQFVYSSDESHGSDISSRTTSDDVELERLTAEDPFSDDAETGMTKKDKKRRKRRRKKAIRMDERFAGKVKASKPNKKLVQNEIYKAWFINALLVASWYAFSLSISIYNKWMFSPKYLDFHFPLFTTCLHMIVQFCLASLVLYFIPRLRPRNDSLSNPQNHYHIRQDTSQTEKPLMTRMFYFTRVSPCGAATGLDIGLGNMSLKFITLTFYTMCKSSSLAFVLGFAFLFRLEDPSIKLVLIITTMTIGVIMMVAGETAFSVLGFVLVILAAFFSGFRWALTQILLLKNPATSNPFSSIFFLAPVMFVSLAIIAIPVEGFVPLAHGLKALVDAKGVFLGVCILIFPGCLAFMMTASEFALLQRTSVVTLSICGIFKEVVTIAAAGIVFKDPLTPINISGLLITIASIGAYNYIKITKMRRDAMKEVEEETKSTKDEDEDGSATEPMLPPPQRTERDRLSSEAPNGKFQAGSNAKPVKVMREND